MTESSDSLADLKQQLRSLALARRAAQPDKDSLSRQIIQRVFQLPKFHQASTVLFYLDARSEVRTRDHLAELLRGDKRLVVPYCRGDHLELCLLRSMEELEPGRFGIPEPRPALRDSAERQVKLPAIDLVLVPGVAFDRQGGRLGHGLGFYDRLLHAAPPEVHLVGLAFECQILDQVPRQPHDVRVHQVVTELQVY